jgi:hypothetical protein
MAPRQEVASKMTEIATTTSRFDPNNICHLKQVEGFRPSAVGAAGPNPSTSFHKIVLALWIKPLIYTC